MRWFERLRWEIVLLWGVLLAFGGLGIGRAEQLSGTSGLLARQATWGALAAGLVAGTAAIDYRRLARWAYWGMAAALALLVAVYFFPPVNGARRWIRLGNVGFQPSEVAKLAYVLALAKYLTYRDSFRRLGGLVAPLGLTLLPLLLVLKEPDLGTALVFVPVLGGMLLAAGARLRHLAVVGLCGAALAPVVWSQMSGEQRSRVTALAAQSEAPRQPHDDDFHLYQAKQLLALGGWCGSWLREVPIVDRTARFVPEAHTDSVFAVLGERSGLAGLAALLACYAALVWRILRVAERTREPFGRLVAIGVGTLIGVQAAINSAMMVGLLPITGLTLPLVSYGGTSLAAGAVALGLVLSVALRPGLDVAQEPFEFGGE